MGGGTAIIDIFFVATGAGRVPMCTLRVCVFRLAVGDCLGA